MYNVEIKYNSECGGQVLVPLGTFRVLQLYTDCRAVSLGWGSSGATKLHRVGKGKEIKLLGYLSRF